MKIHKLPTFAACLEEGGVACVFIVPSKTLKIAPGLLYPAMLEYGFSMPNPIPDLRWTEEGIYATLSFNVTPFETFVPWASVVGIGPKGGDFMVNWQGPKNESSLEEPPPAPKAKLRIVR